MPYTLNDLGTALRAQLYHIVMGGDETAPPPKGTFFTWCEPGIPIHKKDFDFAAHGIWSTTDPNEARARVTHAYNLAMLLDHNPDVEAPYTTSRQEGMYRPDGGEHLSTIYQQILRFSKVVHHELSDAEKQKLEKFRKLLWTTKQVKNLVTDEETEVVEPGPVLAAYNAKMAEYTKAVEKYNTAKVAAATGDVQALAYWTSMERILRGQVDAAADAWTAAGYRNEVDQMNAFINHVGQRDLSLWKRELLNTFDRGLVSSPEFGQFPLTTVVPGDFAESDGWTGFSVSHDAVNWSKQNKASDWKAGANIAFGLWSAGPGASGAKSELSENQQVESFALSFELAQVMIVRPWFSPEWFSNRGWTLRTGEGWMYDDMPSDGATPPHGKFIGYPTMMLCARDIEIKSREFASSYTKAQSSLGADGSIGWGPFKLSGGYHRSSTTETFSSTTDDETLTVPGTQIIALVNTMVGQAPHPLESLEESDFE